MITTFRYGGEASSDKGKIQIPAQQALTQAGPFLPIIITHPQITQEKLKEQGKDIPSVQKRALIDTGAFSSVITPAVAAELGLLQTGVQKVCSVQDEQDRPVYYGRVILPWGGAKELPLVSCPLKGGTECLLGRDILMHWHFTYNGVDGSVTICD